MPPELTDPEGDPGDPTTEPTGAVATAPLPPDAIRNSPEYKELQRQNRLLARQSGQNERAATAARSEAERARQAAEAQQQTDLEAELAETLGEDGIAAFNEIAELSQTDPRAAARRMAELIATGRAQSSVAPPAPTDGQPAQPPEGNVTQPPPSPRGLDAGAPLNPGPAPDPNLALAAELEATYAGVVARNQDPRTRNRVTMKERATGLIAYLGAGYIKGGARPKG